jgi:ParD-like antitoxin of type II bacterial toxin-antitoxin system
MSEEAPPYVSVKLSAGLVKEARTAAHTMRRSVASQIEYWATLGRALESAGLTAADSHALIARQERAQYETLQPTSTLSMEMDDLYAYMLALAKSGALSERAKEAIANERNEQAGKPKKAA